jgi:ABC-type dipeptide/oligopeptide/nickel transport system permease component
MVPTLIGMTFVMFMIFRMAPGLTAAGAFNQEGSRQAKEQRMMQERNEKLRLHLIREDGSEIPLLEQYFRWLWDCMQGDLGDSAKQQGVKVSTLIMERAPRTIIINIFQLFIIYVIAIPGGMFAAVTRGKSFDQIWRMATLILYCLPVIAVGAFAIAYFANPNYRAWFPSGQLHSVGASDLKFFPYLMDFLWHLILPVIVGSYMGFTYLSRLMRGGILDNMLLDYARTARAKGLDERTVLTRHIFRNSLLPLITVFANVLPGLLAGSVIIEYLFSIDGMGRLLVDAARQRDLPVLQAVGLIGGVLTLISLLIRDICYAIADPQISYD